ncbi:hypothetical protein DFH11DRAFT_711826 [Phellopilus nigrolimitatus]|nr:hypothetical protein DFH11DRAFT_711826 [Phellopilus nigrolimitatus]
MLYVFCALVSTFLYLLWTGRETCAFLCTLLALSGWLDPSPRVESPRRARHPSESVKSLVPQNLTCCSCCAIKTLPSLAPFHTIVRTRINLQCLTAQFLSGTSRKRTLPLLLVSFGVHPRTRSLRLLQLYRLVSELMTVQDEACF